MTSDLAATRQRRQRTLTYLLYKHSPMVIDELLRKGGRLIERSRLRITITILRGSRRYSALSGTVILAGARPWSDYLARRFFASPPHREIVGKVFLWRLPKVLERLGTQADITIVHVDRLGARLFFKGNYLEIPESVGSWLPLPSNPYAIARRNRSLKEDLRIIRRERWTSEISHEEADCGKFYDSMYIPSMRRRHGERAVIRNLHQLRRAFRHGGIIWIQRDRQRFAGGIFQQRRRTLHLVALGTAGGDPVWAKKGAIAALYLFSIEYASDHGCARIDFGGTPPILNDGLLRFKRKWGIQLSNKSQTSYVYLVGWQEPNKHVLNFLSGTPLIFRSEGTLAGVTSLQAPCITSPLDAHQQLARSLPIRGLQHLIVLTPDNEIATSFTGLEKIKTNCEVSFRSANRFLQERGAVY
jgi:hypothetical protein